MFEDQSSEPISAAALKEEGFEYVGSLDVDSGTLLLGDPCYWLPCKRAQEIGGSDHRGTDYDSIDISDPTHLPLDELPRREREMREGEIIRMAEMMKAAQPEFDAEKFIELEKSRKHYHENYRYVQAMPHEHGGEGKGFHFLTPHGDASYPVFVRRLTNDGKPGPAAEVRLFLDFQVDMDDCGDGWIPGQLELELGTEPRAESDFAAQQKVYTSFIEHLEEH